MLSLFSTSNCAALLVQHSKSALNLSWESSSFFWNLDKDFLRELQLAFFFNPSASFLTCVEVNQIIINIFIHVWFPWVQQRCPLFLLLGFFWILLAGPLARGCGIYETFHRLLTLCGASVNWLWFPPRGDFILHRVKRFGECQRKEPQVTLILLTRQPAPWWLLFLVATLAAAVGTLNGNKTPCEFRQSWAPQLLPALCLHFPPGDLTVRDQKL